MALHWGRRFDAMLIGLGIIDEPTAVRPESLPAGAALVKAPSDEAVRTDARRKVEAFLGRFQRACARADVACKVLEATGLSWEQIVRESQRYDLVLLGKKTYFHFETDESVDDTLHQVLRNGGAAGGDGAGGARRPRRAGRLRRQRAGLRGPHRRSRHRAWTRGKTSTSSRSAPTSPPRRCVAGRAAEFLGYHGLKAAALPVAAEMPPADVLLDQEAPSRACW